MTDLDFINITSVFKSRTVDPLKTAIICGSNSLSYQDLDRLSDNLANKLHKKGVGLGDLVGIAADRKIETIIGLLAIVKAGAGYVPLPDYYPTQRLEHILNIANIRVVLGDIFDKNQAIKKESYEVISYAEFDIDTDSGADLPLVGLDDVAYVMFTSGSTGIPKGVVVPHRAVLRLVVDQNYMCLDSKQRILQNSPIAFDASTLEIWGALLAGATLIIPEQQVLTLRGLGDVIREQQITAAWLTAGLFHTMADERPEDLKPLQQLLTGGDVVSPTKVAKVKKICPELTIINGYGPTENTTFTCCHRIGQSDLLNNQALPIGSPINGTQVFVLDGNLQPVEQGSEGELCVAGDGLALGYLGQEDLSQATFVIAPWDNELKLYRTGDLVREGANNIYHYIGRVDTQVKIRGFRIELGEIETAIESFAGIRQAVVIAKASTDDTDKQLIAYYLATGTIDKKQLFNAVAQQLPNYSVPSHLYPIDQIPLTANGKVDRKVLSQLCLEGKNIERKDIKHQNQKTDINQIVIEHLQDILDVPTVDPHANFFDLGASSLHIARLHERLEKTLNKTISITDFFLYSNTYTLSQHLSDSNDGVSKPQDKNKADGNASTEATDHIAIIGMSGRFASASNVDEFWDALVNDRELISHYSDEELEFNPLNGDSDHRYVNARGILKDADLFDAQHFGIPPKEAEKLDPQHRILLEIAQEALEDAGYNPDLYLGKIGIFAGNSQNSYLLNNIVSAPGASREFAAGYPVKDFATLFGNDKDFNVTRIAYKLNLRGPAINVQCACSTSLVAVAQACDSLKQGTADMALAGGVSITFPQKRAYLYTPDGMASADGHCRTFDAKATGTVFGDGAGLVVLKRLQDAIDDGDDIVAVIRGHSINNDGSDKIGYAAPSIQAQSEVIKAAHRAADVDPRSIGYIEAHGTGTPLGDPIEFAALNNAFSGRTNDRRTNDKGFCAIGTAKTHVGHLDIAAGVTGLIKTALTLKKQTIPPLLHYTAPNPNIDFSSSAFYPVTEVTPWESQEGHLRRAGISAFGVGGTNIHMVLEEAPVVETGVVEKGSNLVTESLDGQDLEVKDLETQGLQVFPVSATSEAALQQSIKNLGEWSTQHQSLQQQPLRQQSLRQQSLRQQSLRQQTVSIGDLLHTLRFRRRYFKYRATLVADSISQLSAVADELGDKAIVAGTRNRIVMILPGQGAQHINMAKALYENEVVFREALDICANLLQAELDLDLRDVIYPSNDQADEMAELLKNTRIAQPAIFSIEYALAKQWAHWGIRPDILLGHSIGELAAACIAHTIDLKDALMLIALRGRLMSDLPTGTMISVRASEEDIAPYLNEGMDLAAVNGAKACVVAGSEVASQVLEEKLAAAEIISSRLHTSHAFHSHMMEPIVDTFRQAIAKIHLRPPQTPIFSTVVGAWLTDEQAIDPNYWANHMRRPVRFYNGLQYLWENEKHCIFLEVGPGKTLSTLAAQNPNRKNSQPALSSLPHAKDSNSDDYAIMLKAFGGLWSHGYAVEWERLSTQTTKKTDTPTNVKLPPYPFQRRRFWIEPAAVSATAMVLPSAETDTLETVDEACSELSVVDGLKEMLGELSGFDPDDMEENLSFLEMGFDSLLLTQAIRELTNRFGVAVTLRQLIDGFDTLNDLANYIEENGNYHRHLKNTEEMKTIGKSTHTEGMDTGSVNVENVHSMAKQAVLPISVTTDSIERHDLGSNLTPSQRAHIDSLIARYNAKTPQSKALTDHYRPYHADPRTASGFNRLWKEIVYQIVTVKSKGSRLLDIDGNEYIDILNGFGPGFLGHGVDHVNQSLHEQIETGFEVGPQSLIAMETAQLFCEVTGNERASFMCTGSEAVYAAMRLARTCTSRDKIVMFARDYHGNFDEVLVRGIDSKSGQRTMPLAPGIPRDSVKNVVVLPYGTPQSLAYIRQNAHELAAVMVEPVQSRRPEFQPFEFIREVRAITRNAGALFIFDEVVTGFRFGTKGAQAFYGVDADLVTYGKVIGGGMPLGVVSGKAEFMDTFDGGQWQYGDDSFPQAPVTFFAGTFVRHPLVMASLKSMLTFFKKQPPHFWKAINRKGDQLAGTIDRWFTDNDMPFAMPNCGSLMFLRIAEDQKFGALLGAHMRDRGVFLLEGFPSYMTAAHDDEDIDYVIDAFKDSALEMRAAGMLVGRDQVNNTPSYSGPKVSTVPPRLALPGGAEKIVKAMNVPLEAPAVMMTDAQKEVWLAIQMGGDSANIAYNESISLSLTNVVDSVFIQKALDTLAVRHESLRLYISDDGQSILFRETLTVPLTSVDLSNATEAALAALLDKEMSTPFALETDPLVRAMIVLLPNQTTQLILTLHHIICDGWSFGILLNELSVIYNDLVSGKESQLLPADSYEQYALREQSHITHNDLDYWVQQHSAAAADLDLPADYPRPAQRTYDAKRVDHVIDAELTEQLRALARRTKTSFFAVTYTAFCSYIARLTQRDDIVIGVPYAGQLASGMNQLVGHCVNVLPFRIKIDAKNTFEDLLKTVNEQLLTGFDHPNISIGALLSAMTINREASRVPLIPITFNLDKDIGDLPFGDQTAVFSSNTRLAETFELAFNLADQGDTLQAQWSFNKDLFAIKTMEYRVLGFIELLKEITHSISSPITRLPIVSLPEKNKLSQWNDTNKPLETLSPVTEWFNLCASNKPDKVAVEFQQKKVSYSQAVMRVQQICHALLQKNIQPGDLVGLFVKRNEDLPLTMLAVMQLGCAYVPLDPDQPEARLTHILDDANVSYLLTNIDLPPTLTEKVGHVIDLAETSQLASVTQNQSFKPTLSDLAYVIYTSGSTGKPKGVAVKHLGLSNIVKAFQTSPGFSHKDRLLAVTTVAFDIAGLELLLPLSTGATVVIAEESCAKNPEVLTQQLKDDDISVLQCVPTAWQMLTAFGADLPAGLRGWCGGEALPAELAAAIPEHVVFWNVYGPTETTIWSTIHRVVPKQDMDNKLVPIGKAIDNTQLYILDHNKNQQPIGVPGTLWIGGAGVASHYYNRPKLTAERFQPNPFVVDDDHDQVIYDTGDLARWCHDGTIEYMGRKDFQVKIRGFRIELGEIESVLLGYEGISTCIVHAQKDQQGRDVLVGYFVAEEKAEVSDTEKLRLHLSKYLPDYMIPAWFIPLDHLPLNVNGKVDRSQLPSVETAHVETALSDEAVATPKNDVEMIVIHLFKKYLDLSIISMEDNFFDKGGDSLSAVKCIIELNESLSIKLPMAVLLHAPTPTLLIQIIHQEGYDFSIKSVIQLREEKGGIPVFCLMGIQIYAELAELLGKGYAVYALLGKQENDFLKGVFSDKSSDKVLIDIDSLAEEYARLILELNIEGPYYLMGFSSGGVVSIEVAKRLRKQGKEVALVALLDTILPRGVQSSHYVKLKDYLKRLGLYRKKVSPSKEKSQEDKLYDSDLIERRRELLWQSIINWDTKNHRYDGDVTLFQASGGLLDVGSLQLEHGLGWHSIIDKPFDVIDVPGSHGQLLKGEGVKLIANTMRQLVKKT